MDDTVQRLVEQHAEGLLQTLRLARAMVQADRPVELNGLNEQAGLLCAKMMDLPPEIGRQLRPRLIVLLAEVEAVTAALRRQESPTRQKAEPCPSNSRPS